MGIVRYFTLLFAAAVLAACQTTSGPPPVKSPGVIYRSLERSVSVVDHGTGLSPEALLDLADQTEREYAKLSRLFGVHVGPLRVNVRPKGVGGHFPPATIRIPKSTVEKATAITAHEVTHLLTQGWASVVLKEGLAVYTQNRMGEQRGWPNYRRGIHRAAYDAITEYGSPVRTPADAERAFATARLGQTQKRRAAYTVAGSWVTWLIRTQFDGDLRQLMWALYRKGDYASATGKTYPMLETQWRHFVSRRAAQN